MSTQTATKNPTKAERRKAALLAHYDTCARLAIACGVPAEKANGKRISVALLKLEREAHDSATAQCNGAAYNGQPYRPNHDANGEEFDASGSEIQDTPWQLYTSEMERRVGKAIGAIPPGLFVNQDARGFALKIDPSDTAGRELIQAASLATDWGGYGILSPEITGD
jgi:hypothetical protein